MLMPASLCSKTALRHPSPRPLFCFLADSWPAYVAAVRSVGGCPENRLGMQEYGDLLHWLRADKRPRVK